MKDNNISVNTEVESRNLGEKDVTHKYHFT